MKDPTIADRFSAAATTYDDHAAVQQRVAGELIDALQNVAAEKRYDSILELGCGTGRLTGQLRSTFPTARITAVDAAAAMVQRGRQVLSDATTGAQAGDRSEGGIRWIVGDLARDLPPSVHGLVASASALHWLDPISEAVATLGRHLADGGLAAIAVMTRDTLDELHRSRSRVAPLKPPRRRLPTAADWHDALIGAGWQIDYSDTKVHRTRHANAADLLRSLHDQGLTGGAVSRGRSPLTRGEIANLIADYDRHYRGDDGRVVASYHIATMIARRDADVDDRGRNER